VTSTPGFFERFEQYALLWGLLAVVAVLASLAPAVRASRVDPLIVIRSD
jgi:ABC-type lipoprotein release transport system permease subunit